jgi:hypothetical protein
VLWEGPTLKLKDLAVKDVYGLSKLAEEAIRSTFEPIAQAFLKGRV